MLVLIYFKFNFGSLCRLLRLTVDDFKSSENTIHLAFKIVDIAT